MRATTGKLIRLGAKLSGCAVAAYLLARLWPHVDARALWRALANRGPLLALAPAPFLLGMTLDTCGMFTLLRALGNRARLAHLLAIRLASEALHVSVPAGFVAADVTTALLLKAHCNVPLRDGAVALLARKWLVMRAHGLYIALGAFIGFQALGAISRTLVSAPTALPWIVLASAAVPYGISVVVQAGILGGSTFAKMHAVLSRVPSRRISSWLQHTRSEALMTDEQVGRLRAERNAVLGANLAFVGCWCAEALETALLVWLMGINLRLDSVIAIEAGLSLVRSLAVVTPSGLGVVDFGYVVAFGAMGVDAGSAAAFAGLKRAKELAWVAVGYAVLYGAQAGSRRPVRVAVSARSGLAGTGEAYP